MQVLNMTRNLTIIKKFKDKTKDGIKFFGNNNDNNNDKEDNWIKNIYRWFWREKY